MSTSRVFAGLTWKGIALVASLCLVNGVRLMGPELEPGVVYVDWFTKAGLAAGWGMIVAVPVVLAIVAAYNLAPRPPWVRYAAVALALVFSSAGGVAPALAIEAKPDCGVECDATFISHWARYFVWCAFFTVVFVYLR